MPRRTKNEIKIGSFLITKGEVPSGTIDATKHSLDCVGISKKYFTGLYGTNSLDTGGHLASQFARKNGQRVFFLDTFLEVPEAHTTRAQLSVDRAATSHWMHLDRISSELRKIIKGRLLEMIAARFGRHIAVLSGDLTVTQLVLAHPWLVEALMEVMPNIGMLVHPVYLAYDAQAEKRISVWAATIDTERTDRVSVQRAELRHINDVTVTFGE